uniref:UMOD/GP2/OIT3-like D8C domain-containing protein n=1 Tax=Astyanax mexicanus TaxID=7994 RepID=A0A3B1IVD4_ASTMX
FIAVSLLPVIAILCLSSGLQERFLSWLVFVSMVLDFFSKWSGWYRLMLLGQDVRMPESCVGINLCGTDAPLWLSGIHPELLDGIVTREVCGNWNSDCCHFKSTPIRVKACPGVYYVYEFVSPSSCSLTYCAGNDFRLCKQIYRKIVLQNL